MVSLKEVFNNFFKNKHLDLNGEKVVVADSTGVDSSVLLDLALKYLPCEVIICHVNHGKRIDSEKEEEYIVNYANSLKVKCFVYHIKKDEIKGNFQEEARNIRYRFFKKVMREEGAKYLLLAHHLNDDIETMLMRMERGSSLKGFSGIDDEVKIDEGLILRPLLTVLKDDIYEYARRENVVYFEDYTNEEEDYKRNVVRHKDVKTIFSEIASASNDFIEMKKNINNAVCILNEYRDKIIDNTFVRVKDGYKFKIKDFLSLNEYMQKEVIFEITKVNKLSLKAVLEILKIISSDKANICSNINDLTIIKSYEYAYILKDFNGIEKVNYCLSERKEGEFRISPNWIIKVSLITDTCAHNVISNRNILCYNSNWLPITIRSPYEDDEIILDYGTKKVSRILIDRKVDYIDRLKTLVVCNNRDTLMVVGYEKSKTALKECTKLENCDMLIEFIGE